MKKIMFNDRYGLTQAVLNGTKTMTRRIVKGNNIIQINTSDGISHNVDKSIGSYHEYKDNDGKIWIAWTPIKIGDVLAVARSYGDIYMSYNDCLRHEYSLRVAAVHHNNDFENIPGWNNKMFVKANLIPDRIRITNIKLERLQDISDEDCLREGVEKWMDSYIVPGIMEYGKNNVCFDTPREAFANLIDRISGKGTWNSNPWVFAYEFELVK